MTMCFVCGRDIPLEDQQLYRHLQEHNRTGLSLADVLGDDDEWRAWEEADYANDGSPEGAEPVFFVRFDGKPGWDEEPANRPGSVWMFKGGGEHSFGAVCADEAEVRIGFSYRTNAFRKDGKSHLWKTTPMVKNVTLRYYMTPVVRERDELYSP